MQTGGTGRRVAIYAGAVAGIAIVQSVVRTLSRLSILGASRLIVYDLRNRLFSHLQRLPLAYFRKRSTGDIVSRGINDVMLVRSFFGPAVMNLANTTLVYVGSIALMASMSPRLTLYALAPYPLLALGVNLASRRVFARSLAVQEGLAALTNKAQENITGMTLIKTYVREEPEAEAFGSLGEDYLKRNIALARARGVMIPLMGTMSHLGTLVVIFVGGASIIRNELTLGDFVAFNAYLAYLMWPTFALGWILNTFQRGWAALKRIGEILHEPAEVREAEGLTEPPFRGDVEFRSVSYAHAGAPRDILHLDRVSARAKPGEVIGILGTVGSGKTTLVSLVTRILEPPEGAVFVDGEDVLKTSLPRLRRHIAVVPQEPFLFSRSIRANVAYAPREFSEEEILAAVEFSRLSRDLPSFPRGLDTVVGERGFTLSGGQRQRATIGRAIITAPSILILDDPLSSVDAAVEEELLANLRSSARRRTVILISNRVAALAWADRILVMDAGRIVEEGTHADLAAAGGLYAGIARQQSLRAALSEMG
jgi:ATP-binding cassette subfamily B protein